MRSNEKIDIDADLVRRLIAAQFPQWTEFPVKPVEMGGWDNRTFHLGDHMLVRLPSAEKYSSQVEKEQYWLPKLAPFLPLAIPVPLAMGKPGEGYPCHWSVYQWIEGKIATFDRIPDLRQFAIKLAEFLLSLQGIDAAGGPMAGPQNFFRGGAISVYDAEMRLAIAAINDKIHAKAIEEVWSEALSSRWEASPIWVHGDIAVGNLLIKEGELNAVIDFGSMGIGDPACDLAIAWTLFRKESREAFRKALPLDSGTWARGRAWALWKTLCATLPSTSPLEIKRVIDEVLTNR